MPATFEPIATVNLATVSTTTFSAIPQTYTDLRLVVTANASSTSLVLPKLRFNADAGANYSYTYWGGSSGGGMAGSVGGTDDQWSGAAGYVPTNDTSLCLFTYDIMSYSSSNVKKSGTYNQSMINTLGRYVFRYAGSWNNTAAITSITVNLTSVVGKGTATLYGIKGA